MVHIYAPPRLNLENAVQFAKQISELPYHPEFQFDFRRLLWIEPFGMLFTAQAMKHLHQRYPDSRLLAYINRENATSYAAYMSFFTACGLDYGNNPGFRSSGSTYIPITYMQANQLTSKAAIEDIAEEFARQLAHQPSGKLVDIFSYSFREIIRNVIEHSDSMTLGYCAQYWPSKDRVELAILDTGIGLRQSLSQNPNLTLADDSDAIKYALMPGISGKTYEGVKLRPNDIWQNSGYGLYMNYRFCNEGGDFFICSGSKGLYRNVNNDQNHYFNVQYAGTALRLCINTAQVQNVSKMLERFKNEGETAARSFGLGAVLTASTMSQMLKDNFKSIKVQIQVGDTVKHRQYGEGEVTEKVIVPPFGEMLWVTFKGGRRKRVETKDVILLDRGEVVYEDDLENSVSDEDDLPPNFSFEDSEFDDPPF